MNKIHQKIELTANILVIVVAVLIGSVFIQRYVFPSTPASSEPELPKVGDKVALANFDWSKSKKNLLLLLQKECHYCSDSVGFYKVLIQHIKAKDVNIVAVLPQNKEESEKYLRDLGITGIEVRQSQLKSLLVAGTPTVILANDKGEITNVWIGKLSPEKENEVLGTLKG
jgi:thioredoxin-related protein